MALAKIAARWCFVIVAARWRGVAPLGRGCLGDCGGLVLVGVRFGAGWTLEHNHPEEPDGRGTRLYTHN